MSSSASARLAPLAAGRRREAQRRDENAGAVPRFERDLHRLAHGELGEQRAPPGTCGRGRAAARCARRSQRDTSSPSSSTAPVARHEAADRVHQRRLAGAVGADQPDDLVRADLERRRRRPRPMPPNRTRHARAPRERRRVGAPVRDARRGAATAGGASRSSSAGGRAQPPLEPAEERVARRSSRSARGRRGSTAAGRAGRCST